MLARTHRPRPVRLQTLREQMHQESQRSSRTMQSTVDASRVAELEAAQAAAQAALMEEMELLRRQKQSSEGHAQELDEQVGPAWLTSGMLKGCSTVKPVLTADWLS